MKRYFLPRVYLPEETLGSIYSAEDLNPDSLICKTMELPWRLNQRKISCIPEAVYRVTKEKPIPKDNPNTPQDESGGRKPRDYGHFRIHDVPNRSGVLVHRITFVKDLLGCIGVGGRFHDFNSDGVPDMADSSSKLQWMVENMPDEFELEISRK